MKKKPTDSAIENSELWHFYALDKGECPDLESREVNEWQFDIVHPEQGINSQELAQEVRQARPLTKLQEEIAKRLPAT